MFEPSYINYIVMVAAIVIIVSCFITLRVKRGGVYALAVKAIASMGLIVAAFYGIIEQGYKDAYSFIILGLIFGLIGDILLDLKVIYRQHDEFYTNAGMLSFGIGHLMYLVAIISLSNISGRWIAAVVAVVVAIAISSLIMWLGPKFLKLDFGRFFWQSYVYSFLLLFMMSFSVYLSFMSPRLWFFGAGLSMFLLSDLILSTQYFGNKLDSKLLIIVNHATYYVAQILIMSAIFFI